MPFIVIEKARSKEENLPSVRLFRTELDAILQLFNEYCATQTISDDEYVYKDFDEMRERVGTRFKKLQILGSDPSVSLSFELYGVKLAIVYKEGDSADVKKRGDHLFLQLREFLGKHETIAAQLMNNTATTIFSVVGVLTILISIVTSPRPENLDPNSIYLNLKHGLFLIAGVLMVVLVSVLGMRRTGHHIVYYGYAHEITTFWTRKKDDLLFGLLMAVVGVALGVVGTLITQHFVKK